MKICSNGMRDRYYYNQKKILFLLFIFTSFQVSSKNYYVAKTGNDSNEGTISAPFLTVSKAASILHAGDTCFIKAGVYRETIDPSNSGSEGNPIVFTNFENDSVLISGTEKLDNWVLHEGTIYKANYKMALGRQNMVFCNGDPMDWARWPNNTDNDPYTVQGIQVVSGTASTVSSPQIPNLNWVGGYIWYLGAHSGTSWTREITASSAGKITFTAVDITKWPFNPHNPTIYRNGNYGQFYLFGTMDALDYEREWYFDENSDLVYFKAPGGVDPNTLDVEVAVRMRTIYLSKNYIQIDGIDAFGGKIEIAGSNCAIKNGTFKNCLQILDELDNTDAQVGDGSILVRASNTLIENNIIDGGSINGIFVQGWGGVENVTIKNNVIRHFDTVGIHASPIRTSAVKVIMLSNTISKTGRDGVYCGGTNCEIAYNDISGCMNINNDGGVFYTVGNASDKNTIIHHNWIHDSYGPEYADGRAAGIYLDNNSKGYSVHHNVVWNVTWSGIQINWDNWNIDIFNNSIYNVERAMGRWENGYTIQDLIVKNNYASIEEFIGTDISGSTNIIQASSPFRSVQSKDFRPATGASLIDHGEVIPGITDGFYGTAPDIGAYEYGLTPWTAGVGSAVGGEIDPTTGFESVDNNVAGFSLYPNPLDKSDLTIDLSCLTGKKTISIISIQGVLLEREISMKSLVSIPRALFQGSGIYFVKVDNSSQSVIKKLVVD